MGMLSRLRNRLETGLAERLGTEPERFNFSAELPAGRRGPVCRVNVQLLVEPQREGERFRLRAHVQTNLASVLRPALRAEPLAADAPSASDPTPSPRRALVPASAQRAGELASRGLQRVLASRVASRVVNRLAEPLLQRDFNTWIEIQASTEPLHEGAHSLIPQQDRLAALGIRPARGRQGLAETWSGITATGAAQLSLLQINKSDLPEDLQRRLGPQPFQLAAAIVSTAERK